MNKNILWIEDNPHDVIADMCCYSLDPRTFLDRIVFAYDFKSGVELLKQSPFPLIILDADFPNDIGYQRRLELDAMLERCRTVGKPERLSYGRRIDGDDNFIPFYVENIKPIRMPDQQVVVFSISQPASAGAFSIGLPFYSKSESNKQKIEEWIKMYLKMYVRGPDPEALFTPDYEFGTAKEFFTRFFPDRK